MGITSFRIAMALVAGFALVSVPGCSKKTVQSGGDTQSQKQAAKSGSSDDAARSGVGSFPDTSMQSGGGPGLRGLDKLQPLLDCAMSFLIMTVGPFQRMDGRR